LIKLKLGIVFGFLIFGAFALSGSGYFAASAKEDILSEIAGYKTWKRIDKEPIKVASGFQVDGQSGDENTFVIDGEEITNFRTGALSG
jgi:hypothetical protein